MSKLIDHLKKQAKSLLKHITSADPKACAEARLVLRDLQNVPDGGLAEKLSLMRAQHVIAVQHGFEKWEELIASDPILLRLAVTMQKVPELNDFGIGTYSGFRNLPESERLAKFQENRRILRQSVDRVEATMAWLLANVEPTKSVRRDHDSYGMKHLVEQEIDYITNGVFIAAGIMAGYEYELRPPNALFAMGRKGFTRTGKERRERNKPHAWMQAPTGSSGRTPLENLMEQMAPVLRQAEMVDRIVPRVVREQMAMLKAVNPMSEAMRQAVENPIAMATESPLANLMDSPVMKAMESPLAQAMKSPLLTAIESIENPMLKAVENSLTVAKRFEDLSGVSKIMRDQERLMKPFKAIDGVFGTLAAVERLAKRRF